MEMSADAKKTPTKACKFCREYFLNLMSCITTNFKRRNYFLCYSPCLFPPFGCRPQLGRVVSRNFIWQSFHVSRVPNPFSPACMPLAVAALVMQKLKFFGKVQALPKVFVLLALALSRSWHAEAPDMRSYKFDMLDKLCGDSGCTVACVS